MRRRTLVVAVAAAALAACGAPAAPGGTATPSATASSPPSPPSPLPSITFGPTMPESPSHPVITATPAPAATPTPAATTAPATSSASLLPASLAGAEWTQLPTGDHVVALTFDAGGNDAGVATILATLQAQHIPATFFLTGRWCQVYPAQGARIAASYDVGNHTFSHPYLTQLSDAQVRAEILEGEQAIRTATGGDPHPIFRFPYGDSDARTLADAHALGYGGIRWTVDTLGWKGAAAGQSVDSVVARAVAALRPGAIVLMHVGAANDGTTLDADALPRLISALRSRGYGFAAILDYAR